MSREIEFKITLTTSSVNGHTHDRFFEEGRIPAGNYRTSEDSGHRHFFTIEDDLPPGESVTLTTAPSDVTGDHQHRITVRAVAVGSEERGAHEDDEERGLKMEIETKSAGGRIVEVKQATRNGVEIGILEGYIATWDADEGGVFGVPERFNRGAFTESLAEHRARGNRQIRLKDHHGQTIGGFPIESVREDEVGLFGIGEVNLETQFGREDYSLAKQGVLTDFSIGFSVRENGDRIEDGVREIFQAIVWEGSIIDEPMNRAANIVAVKSAKEVVSFQDLPLADRERRWDQAAALARMKSFTDSDESASRAYRKAFVWFDQADAELFESYKFPIADVVDGRLTAVPRALFAAAARFDQTDIPEADRPKAIRHLERYYAKMDLPSPFDPEERQFFGVDEVKAMDVRDLEVALKKSGSFSKGAARLLAGRLSLDPRPNLPYYQKKLEVILQDLEDATEHLKG